MQSIRHFFWWFVVLVALVGCGAHDDEETRPTDSAELPGKGGKNAKPVAVPGGPYSGTLGSAVSFDGSGSYDPDGSIISYSWSFGDGGTATGATAEHTFSSASTFTVTLTVTDNRNATHTATTTASVSGGTSRPKLSIGGPATLAVGAQSQYVAYADGQALAAGDPNVWWYVNSENSPFVSIGTTTGVATGLAAGTPYIQFDYLHQGVWESSVGSTPTFPITVTSGSLPPPPPPPSGRGPQASITCPAGSINISPGTSIQSVVNASAATSTFCIRAGVHDITSAITPKSGNTFVGEYGAILDGSGWITTNLEQGAFRAHNEDINDVTIKNLVIRKMPQRGIHTYSSGMCANGTCNFSSAGADRWTVENNDILDNVKGITGSSGMIIRNNRITGNIGDPEAPTLAKGGGYSAYLAQDILFENNEIANNGTEQKICLSRDVVFRDNFVHHNAYDGIWYDGENTGWLVENNTIQDNKGAGVFIEVSGEGTVRNNTLTRNETGVLVSLSHNADIYGNVIDANFRAITYFVDCSRVGSPEGNWIGEPFSLQNVASHGNTIHIGTQSGVLATALSYTSCTSSQLAEYTSGSKNLTFSSNTYTAPDVSGWYWLWGGGSVKTWSAWQAVPQDTGSTLTQQ